MFLLRRPPRFTTTFASLLAPCSLLSPGAGTRTADEITRTPIRLQRVPRRPQSSSSPDMVEYDILTRHHTRRVATHPSNPGVVFSLSCTSRGTSASEALFVTSSNDRKEDDSSCAPVGHIVKYDRSSGITDAKGTASSASHVVWGEFWYGQVASQDVLGGGNILEIS